MRISVSAVLSQQKPSGGGGGTPAFGGVAALSVSSTQSVTVTLPSGYSTGDLLLVHFTPKANGAMTHTMTAGWTQIGSTVDIDAGFQNMGQSIWYKFATSASETAPVADNGIGHACYAVASYWTNVNSLVEVSNGTADDTSSNYAGTSATGLTSGSMVVGFAGSSDDNALGLLSGSEQGFTLGYGGTSYDSTTRSDASQAGAYKSLTGTSQQFPTFEQTVNGPDFWVYHEVELKG